MTGWGRRIVVTAVAVALAFGMTGCDRSTRWGAAPCLPAALVVAPSTASPGEALSVSSPPADCDLGYGDGHEYSISLMARGVTTPPTTVIVSKDGAFSAEVRVPPDFPAGDGFVTVAGSPYDECGTDGTGSCAGYEASITVR